MSIRDHFVSDPAWAAFAAENGLPLPSITGPPSLGPIEPLPMNIEDARAGQAESDAEWVAAHPLESVRYVEKIIAFKVRDGEEISVRITHPSRSRLRAKGTVPLPVLFVTHGGGWMQGSHFSEEEWLVWPLYQHFDIVVVSVEYRLFPEHQFPMWIDDSWDVLENLVSPTARRYIGSNLGVELDPQRIILAGSSSGATISAVLSQMCVQKDIPIWGVILNVPVLCDYRHFPTKYLVPGQISSYQQCVETYSSGAMVWVWNQIHNSSTGRDPIASPLLGDCVGLPKHLIFVAGQDALRDEGIAYAKKLGESGVKVRLEVFDGVPHNFAHFGELKATMRFRDSLRIALEQWLSGL